MTEISSYLRAKQEFRSTPIASYVPYNKSYLPENSVNSPSVPASSISSVGTDNSSLESFRSRSFSAPADYVPEAF